MVSASGDGSTIVIAESNSSGGPFSRYDVASRTITRSGGTGWFNYECAVSRDASLFAPAYLRQHFYLQWHLQPCDQHWRLCRATPIGAAFHPSADAVFFPFAGTTYVKAYNTTTWEMLAQFDFQTPQHTRQSRVYQRKDPHSADGQIIFVTVNGGVQYCATI